MDGAELRRWMRAIEAAGVPFPEQEARVFWCRHEEVNGRLRPWRAVSEMLGLKWDRARQIGLKAERRVRILAAGMGDDSHS